MRARAQINEITTSVGRDTLAILYLSADGGDLEWVVLEQGQRLFLRQHEAFKGLLLTCDFLCALLDCGVIFL